MSEQYFKIENVELVTIEDYQMVKFDLVAEKGRVTLWEWIKFNLDGDYVGVSKVDTHIETNMAQEFCSVFDMSEKPPFMPPLDYLPFYEVLDAVEEIVDQLPDND